MNKKQMNVSGISKFLFSTLLAAAAMTSTAWGHVVESGKTYQAPATLTEKIEVRNGAVLGNAHSKWDVTKDVIIDAGGQLASYRSPSSGYGNTHVKAQLTVNGMGTGEDDIVALNFLDNGAYKTGCLTVLYNGKMSVNNAKVRVGDLGSIGATTFTNSKITVGGSLGLGIYNNQLVGDQKMTGSTMNVTGKNLNGEGTYYTNGKNLIANMSMDSSSIVFAKGADEVILGGTTGFLVFTKDTYVTMSNESLIKAEEGTLVTVAKDVSLSGNSKLDIGELIIASGKKLNITDSTLSATSITNNGTITFSGVSSLTATEIVGGNVVVSSGATLTVPSISLLGNITNNGGTLIFSNSGSEVEHVDEITSNVTLQSGTSLSVGTLDSSNSVTLNENSSLTVGNPETGTVKLTSSAKDVVVSSVTVFTAEKLEAVAEELKTENMVAAWDFEITNESEGNIEVSTTIGSGLDVTTIKIWHGLENGSWELLNDKEGFTFNYNAENGALTFSTNSFSPIAVEAAAAPEPSAFGLLAGLGALALVASRRRRK